MTQLPWLRRLALTLLVFTGPIVWAIYQTPIQPEPLASRFIKLDASGNPLPPWAGPWACVKDQKTQLIWEVKTNTETIHDGYWSYSWFNGSAGKENWGDCYFEANRCDTNDLIRRTRQQQLCGLANWRLPSQDELNSLLTQQTRPGEALIDKDFFPHTKRGDYWTANHNTPLKGIFEHLGTGAEAINFGDGQTRALPYRNAAFVRLVHASIDTPKSP